MIAGIILAGGKGTRINMNKVNKVTIPFKGKPLILYGVDLFNDIVDKIFVVVGAYADSVKNVLKQKDVYYAHQKKRLGTGHAVITAVKEIENLNIFPTLVLIGYGDHMMFYTKKIIKDMISMHKKEKAAVSFISTEYDDPDYLVWGRVIRDKKGNVIDSIEQKDATKEQRKIKESNAGFYCVDYKFLKDNIHKFTKSQVSGEYYINENLIRLANKQKRKICALKVPFKYVGIGINTWDQLERNKKLF